MKLEGRRTNYRNRFTPAEIGAVEFVEAGFGELELGLGGGGAELVGAELGQQMADEGSGEAVD